jgi:hypothetical protein
MRPGFHDAPGRAGPRADRIAIRDIRVWLALVIGPASSPD